MIKIQKVTELIRRFARWRNARSSGAGTIRTRLLVSFVLIVLLPAIVITATTVARGIQGGQQQVVAQLESVATLKENEIDTWLRDLQTDLNVELARSKSRKRIGSLLQVSPDTADFQTAYGEQITRFLQTIELLPKFEELFLMDAQGQVILSTDVKQEGKVYSSETYFRRGLEGPHVQSPFYSPSLGRMSVIVARPVVDEQGNAIGVLAGRASMAALSQIMSERAGLGRTGETYLVGANYAMLTASRFEVQDNYVRTEGAKATIRGRANGSGMYQGYRDVPVVGVFHWLPELQVALLAEQDRSEAFRATYETVMTNTGVAIAAVLAAGIVALFITRSISNPLTDLSRLAMQIADGDLERVAQVGRKDEIGTLAKAFNRMTARLRDMLRKEQEEREHLEATVLKYVEYENLVAQGNLKAQLTVSGNGRGENDPLVVLGKQLNATTTSLQAMIVQVREAANALTAQAAEILATTTQQASGATEQSAAVSQATTTVDQIKTIAEQLVTRSRTVAEAAQRTVEVSRSGQEVSRETIAGMGQIKTRVDVIEENILALSERTQQIGEIIDSVNAIASQSNMLALNAAVEAARAGEQGKGFAVVAQEVRDLAERSTQATSQVKTILSDIQKATASTAMATEEGKKGVDAGVELVEQMRDTIDQLAGVIDESAQSAMQMSAGGQQQTTGMEQIAVTMGNINQVTMQNMASTRQAEKAAQELNELACALTETVEQYRL
jgi:methyl-accepting chemotaxis protein